MIWNMGDRKSTRLNFSHSQISYAVFCLKKKVSLSYGVDDLHGTIMEEKIFHMAGATTPQQQSIAALEHAIREARRIPVQRDSYYRHLNASEQRSTSSRPRSEAELACA